MNYNYRASRRRGATKSGECENEKHENNDKNNIIYNTDDDDDDDDDTIVSMEMHTPNET